MLTRWGYITVIPHFFDCTQTVWADPTTHKTHFTRWLKCLSDVIDFMATHPLMNHSGIGVVGFSLGATLALALPSRNQRIAAIAEFFGEMPWWVPFQTPMMPPIMFIHGESDHHIPVDSVLRSVRHLRLHGTPCEVRVYPNERHVLSPGSIIHAAKEVKKFLNEYL
jgi:dienelactone hydrolase